MPESNGRTLAFSWMWIVKPLNVIRYEHSHSVDDCFKDMLKKWLTGNGERTWSKLAHALENITVGFTNLSNKIKEKYCN